MMIDIDKAIEENEIKILAMMNTHRELMAKQDREIAELRNQLNGLIGVLADCKLEMRG
tara:strand:+ start:251 stop:424 length:174 start_codon:yes stop_codon:yes gene_type:complete